MKKTKYIVAAVAVICILVFGAMAQEESNQSYYGGSRSIEVERLASRMERFMMMHVEVVRNQMQLNSLLGELIELEKNNAQNGRFTHISDSTYFDTRTAEIFKRPKP